MTDDQTRSYDTSKPDPSPATAETPVEAAPAAAAEPAAAAGPTSASVVPPTAAAATTAATGPNRMRLLAGLGVAGVVLLITAGALLLLGGSSTPEALKYIPADAAFVAELRMDLPGDQMQKLGNFLAKFPGFADQSTLPAKLDEAFGKIVTSASDGTADYVGDVKPWLNGPFFAAVDAGSMHEGTDGGTKRFLVSATTNGGVACASTFEGRPTTTETYRGVALTIASEAPQVACAVDGRFALLGDVASVKRALDSKADGTGIDKSTAYAAARRALSGEQLATLWFDGRALRDAMPSPDPSLGIPGLAGLTPGIPDWLILGLRAEDDALVLDGVAAPVAPSSAGPSLLPVPPAHASALVGLVPADTLVYIEDQGTGVSLRNLLTTLRTIPELEAPLQMLDGVADPGELVGWVQDAAIAVSASGSDPESLDARATVLLAAADAATATEKVAGIRGLLALAALGGEGIEVTESTVVGHEVTTVTIADLGALVPPGTIPDPGAVPTGGISFSIAAIDRVIYLIVGEGVEQVLGLPSGASLANDAAFKQATARGLQNSRTTTYVAAGAALDLVEPFLPDEIAAQWATDVEPYVDPIQAIGAWSTSDASGMRFRTVFTVAGP